MTGFARHFAAIGFVLVTLVVPISAAAANETEHGICEEQIVADVKARFGQNITKLDWTMGSTLDGPPGMKSQALVYTDGCPGYHVYDVHATDHDCTNRAHLWTPPNYIRYRLLGSRLLETRLT